MSILVNGLKVGREYVQEVKPEGDVVGHRIVKRMRMINHNWIERRGVECECGRKYWGCDTRADRTQEAHARKQQALGIKPTLPRVGDKVSILGVRATVAEVEPESDWSWRVGLESVNALGATERWWICVPTDYRTEDGMSILDGNLPLGDGDDDGPTGDDIACTGHEPDAEERREIARDNQDRGFGYLI